MAGEPVCGCGHQANQHGRRRWRPCHATEPERCSCLFYRPIKTGTTKVRKDSRARWVYGVGYSARLNPDTWHRETELVISREPRRWWLVGTINNWLFGLCGGYTSKLFDAIDQHIQNNHHETFTFSVPPTEIEKFSEWRGWGSTYWADDEDEPDRQATESNE